MFRLPWCVAAMWSSAAGLCGDDAQCHHSTASCFAPVFRLDKTSVTEKRCLPGHPATVYEQRKAGYDETICEADMSKLDEVPIFYHYEECGGGVVVIDYWIWYSHQAACLKLKAGGIMDETYGEHRADWERVAVHIRDDKVKRVRYHQHSGSYTKKRKNVEFVDSKHPVAYVGQDSHGSYHDQGGTGNCLYFQDFRRFDDPRLKVEGWKFLISIKNESDALPEWFDGERQYLDSFPPPAQLKGRSGCDMSSCSGKDDWVEATETCAGVSCGCHKSDYCDDIKFGAISDEKPCEQTLINEVTSEAKDRLKGLFGSAQVSSTSKLNALRAVAFALGLCLLAPALMG